MKTNFTLFLLTSLAIFTMQSCYSPHKIVKLQPETKNVKWRFGQQFITDSLNGIIFEIGYEQIRNNRYWFDFSITNRSNLPILINPANISCQAFDTTNAEFIAEKVAAIDPETEILGLEKELAKK